MYVVTTAHEWLSRRLGLIASDCCLIWPHHVSNSGYGKFTYANQTFYAHRYVCEFQNGPSPEGLDAAHSCGNRLCVNPSHLTWKTRVSNINDKKTHGTQTFGELHTPAKITEADALRIIKDRRTHQKISKDYPICRQTISRIKSGEIWPHLHCKGTVP